MNPTTSRLRFKLTRVITACVGTLIASGLATAIAHATPGNLDRAFNGDGKLLSRLSSGHTPFSVGGVIDSAGRTVVAANRDGAVYLTRFLPDGSRDPAFGSGGETTISLDRIVSVKGLAIDSQDRVVIAGNSVPNPDVFGEAFILRLLPDGRPDASFDGDGLVITDDLDLYAGSGAIAIDEADRIVVAGNASDYVFTDDTLVERFDGDGHEDAAFHANTRTSFCGSYTAVRDIAIDQAGRIVLVGADHNFDPDSNNQPLICRLLPDGRSDPSFSGDGQAVYRERDLSSEVTSVAVDSRGRIVVSPLHGFGAARLRGDGSFDRSFGDDGRILIRMSRHERFAGDTSGSAVTVDSRDRPILSGTISEELQAGGFPRRHVFGFARLTANGKPDPSFGNNGRRRIAFGKPKCPPRPHPCPAALRNSASGGGPVLYPGGRVVSVGVSLRESGNYIAIARLHLR